MKIGIFLPQFNSTPERAFIAASAAEQAGIDGVFMFDHMIAPDNPAKPSLSLAPLLGAVSARTAHVSVGTLVWRVGVVTADVMKRQVLTVREVAGDRLVVCLGMSSWTMEAESELLQVPLLPIEERAAMVREIALDLVDNGIETWISSRSMRMHQMASEIGASVSLWAEEGERLDVVGAVPTIWSGSVPVDPVALATRIRELREEGFSWAVFLLRGIGSNPGGAVEALARGLVLA